MSSASLIMPSAVTHQGIAVCMLSMGRFKWAGLVSVMLLCFVSMVRGSMLDGLTSCLRRGGVQNFTTIQSNPALYYELLDFSLVNLRFTGGVVPKPSVLIIPSSNRDVQNAVACSVKDGWELRVRSGGHSYEAFSSISDIPFVIIDMMQMDNVKVDINSKTAWAQAGATLGQIYYAVSQQTADYGFSGGSCPTVGSGGHISGGGFGFLSRKYGLAADNVIDAQLVDADGNLLDKHTMGEDVFWALRGGGGGNWGVVVAWKLNLVSVPPILTVFNITRTGRPQVIDLVHKWQETAASAPQDLYLSARVDGIQTVNLSTYRNGTISNLSPTIGLSANFKGQYLGRLEEALKLITDIFPELRLTATECKEMNWIRSIQYFSDLPLTDDLSPLAERFYHAKSYFKAKSDYVTTPIPKQALEQALMFVEESLNAYVILDPYGGRMAEIPSNAIAFPHRTGNLYCIQYQAHWNEGAEEHGCIARLERFYNFVTTYVYQSPRAAYVNYVDLDIGAAVNGTAGVEEARRWGESYFLGNFGRMVKAKTQIDPYNVFRNPQSIPPASSLITDNGPSSPGTQPRIPHSSLLEDW